MRRQIVVCLFAGYAAYAGDASAARIDDAIDACLANAHGLITQDEALWRKSNGWTSYAKQLCDKVITTREQADQKGLNLDMAPLSEAGVPVPFSFNFSSNQTERDTFDRLYCANTSVQSANSDEALVIRGANSKAVALAMSRCVVQELSTNDDFWCDVSQVGSSKGEPLFVGDIHFRPKTTMQRPTIVDAAVHGAGRAALAVQGRRALKGRQVLVGSNTFTAVLKQPGLSPVLKVQLSNGMACTVPIVRDNMLGKIWIAGWSLQEAPPAAFTLSDSKDCGDNETRTARYCIDPFEAPDISKPLAHHLSSSNCGDGASQIRSLVRDSKDARCAIATYNLKGCGYDEYKIPLVGTVRNCRGSGWIGETILVPRKTTTGAKAAGPKEMHTSTEIPGPIWSQGFNFMLQYPQQATLDPKVEWEVQIDYAHKSTPQRGKATLTSANPTHFDMQAQRCFRAEGGKNLEQTGVMVYADTCAGAAREGRRLTDAERKKLDEYVDPCYSSRRSGSGLPQGTNPGASCSAP